MSNGFDYLLSHGLGWVLTLFPISFFIYFISERLLMTHQSRVGLGQSISAFFSQAGINHFNLIRRPAALRSSVMIAIQFSLLAIVPMTESDFEKNWSPGGIWIVLIGIALVMGYRFSSIYSEEQESVEVIQRTSIDRRLMMVFSGGALALISVLSIQGHLGTWSLTDVIRSQSQSPFHWNLFQEPFQWMFFILFQIAGMVIFEEHPFSLQQLRYQDENNLLNSGWIRSARFYIWSLLSVSIFLGSGWLIETWVPLLSFITLHFKAAVVFIICRLIGLYFPKYSQQEAQQALLVFLIPTAMAVLILSWLLRCYFMLQAGGFNA
jgi:hypothetical protein